MEVGEAAAAAGDVGLEVLTLISVTSVSLSRHSTSCPFSPFTSDYAQMDVRAPKNTHTHTGLIKARKSKGTKGRRRQFT